MGFFIQFGREIHCNGCTILIFLTVFRQGLYPTFNQIITANRYFSIYSRTTFSLAVSYIKQDMAFATFRKCESLERNSLRSR